MSATATLVYTSSRAQDNALRIARVAAAGRVAAERVAREAQAAQIRAMREAQSAQVLADARSWVEDLRAAGAVRVGFKICLAEGGKWRTSVEVAEAAEFLAHEWASEDDVEAWGLDAEGGYVGGTF